jgi:hypothetical protein
VLDERLCGCGSRCVLYFFILFFLFFWSSSSFLTSFSFFFSSSPHFHAEIPLDSGFAPISFAWRKACERTPGLAIASDFQSVLGSPDVASDGTIKPDWDVRNATVVDTAHKSAITQREFYFWVDPTKTNVQAAVFKRTNYTSTMHPSRGATSLVCQPAPTWQSPTNYVVSSKQCTGPSNACSWANLPTAKVSGNAPTDPLNPGDAPLRVVFSYDECKGQGAVLLSFEVTFGEFDLVRVGWYKYVGTPPGLTMSCVSGCPTTTAGKNGSQPMIVNGIVQGAWRQGDGPALENRIIQSSWLLSADIDISDYDFQLAKVDPETSGLCAVGWSGELAKHFTTNGNWNGAIDFVPGSSTVVVNLVYLCSASLDPKTSYHMMFSFQNFASVTIAFTKDATYSKKIFVGSGNQGNTELEDVNAQGSPTNKWKTPEAGCLLPEGQDKRNSCIEDARGTDARSFYVSYMGDASQKTALVPAPTKDGAQSKQYPGVHSTYFFSYNSSDMFGCEPFWEVSQMSTESSKGIKNRADFIAQGKATLVIGGEPLKVTINYNCSKASSRCSKPGACAALFTGFIPISADGCDSTKPGLAPCASPSFKWIKTVAPVQPGDSGVNWVQFPLGGNVTWTVPNSGDGEDLFFNQRIKSYNITVVDLQTKEKRQYLLPGQHGSSFAAPLDTSLLFSLWNMTGESYDVRLLFHNFFLFVFFELRRRVIAHLLLSLSLSLSLSLFAFLFHPQLGFNMTNDAGLSYVGEDMPMLIRPGKTIAPSQPLSEEYIAALAAGSGVLVVLAACCMYHCCIKAGDEALEKEQPLLGVQASTLNNESSRGATQQQQRFAEENPYIPGEFSPPVDDPQFSDADTMLKGLLAEN